jgi:large subunit ribosomal protein L28
MNDVEDTEKGPRRHCSGGRDEWQRKRDMKCEITGKQRSFGHNVSHAKNRTNRYWLPNVQKKRVMINGKMVRIQISTRALRTLTKTGRMAAKGK